MLLINRRRRLHFILPLLSTFAILKPSKKHQFSTFFYIFVEFSTEDTPEATDSRRAAFWVCLSGTFAAATWSSWAPAPRAVPRASRGGALWVFESKGFWGLVRGVFFMFFLYIVCLLFFFFWGGVFFLGFARIFLRVAGFLLF